MSLKFNLLTDHINDIGEGPIWSEYDHSIYWVDAGLKPLSIFKYDTHKESTIEIKLPFRPASLRLNQQDQLLIGYQRGFALLDIDTHKNYPIEINGVNFQEERFNDSGADSRGRLWIGTFDRNLKDKKGKIYKFDHSLDAQEMDGDFMMSNAIRWSPDYKTMYFCDSRPGVIYAYEYDIEIGKCSNRRVFLDFNNRTGRPDGATVDVDGNLWVAEIDAGLILQINPNGIIINEISVPVSRPTSLTFGGRDLKTLFITSMTFGLNSEQLSKQFYAGKLFSIDTNSSGIKENYLFFKTQSKL